VQRAVEEVLAGRQRLDLIDDRGFMRFVLQQDDGPDTRPVA
jgi:hypothetical protein